MNVNNQLSQALLLVSETSRRQSQVRAWGRPPHPRTPLPRLIQWGPALGQELPQRVIMQWPQGPHRAVCIWIQTILIFKSLDTQNTLPNGIVISILQRCGKGRWFAQHHRPLNDSSRQSSRAGQTPNLPHLHHPFPRHPVTTSFLLAPP